MEISLELEAASLLITLLLLVLHVDRQQRGSRRYQIFNLSLILSASAILLNILSSWGINNAATLPLWLNNSLDMAYFLLICGSDFLFRAAYGFDGPKCDDGLFRRWNSKKPQGCGCRRAIGTEILLNTVEKRFLGRVCCNFSRCRTD